MMEMEMELELWLENPAADLDATPDYLEAAGHDATERYQPADETGWARFLRLRADVEAAGHSPDPKDDEALREELGAPSLVAGIRGADRGARDLQYAVSRTARTWEEFAREALLERR